MRQEDVEKLFEEQVPAEHRQMRYRPRSDSTGSQIDLPSIDDPSQMETFVRTQKDLGVGACGTVATYQSTRTPTDPDTALAVKYTVLKYEECTPEEMIKASREPLAEAYNEFQLFHRAHPDRHKRSSIECRIVNKKLYILFTMCILPGRTFKDFTRIYWADHEKLVLALLATIAAIRTQLHDNNIAQLDLNTGNVLVTEEAKPSASLLDFGMAVEFARPVKMREYPYTFSFCPPETFSHPGDFQSVLISNYRLKLPTSSSDKKPTTTTPTSEVLASEKTTIFGLCMLIAQTPIRSTPLKLLIARGLLSEDPTQRPSLDEIEAALKEKYFDIRAKKFFDRRFQAIDLTRHRQHTPSDVMQTQSKPSRSRHRRPGLADWRNYANTRILLEFIDSTRTRSALIQSGHGMLSITPPVDCSDAQVALYHGMIAASLYQYFQDVETNYTKPQAFAIGKLLAIQRFVETHELFSRNYAGLYHESSFKLLIALWMTHCLLATTMPSKRTQQIYTIFQCAHEQKLSLNLPEQITFSEKAKTADNLIAHLAELASYIRNRWRRPVEPNHAALFLLQSVLAGQANVAVTAEQMDSLKNSGFFWINRPLVQITQKLEEDGVTLSLRR